MRSVRTPEAVTSQPIPVEVVGRASEAAVADAHFLVSGRHTLHDLLLLTLRMSPARLVKDVVVQDEYSHDVVLPGLEDHWLVFDTT